MALVAPAGPLTAERLEASEARCRALGFEPILFPGVSERTGFLAGSDHCRLRDLQSALDDPSFDAVWALRGGYGITRILSQVDFSGIDAAPKAYIGFSDNTALHAALFTRGIVSFHGPHPGAAFPAETEDCWRRVLMRAEPAGLLPTRPEDPAPVTLVGGAVSAPLLGGNLALLAALCGTSYCVRAEGCILFLEDVGEAAYRIDRMLVQLRDAGVLAGVAGLALGRFTEAPNGEAHQVRVVLEDFARGLNVPAVFDLPIGHIDHNWTLPLGIRATLNADAATLELVEPAVVKES